MSYASQNFRYLRKLRGYTQEEFANKLGIKRSLVGAYEEQRAEPKLEVLNALCALFKLSLDDILLTDLTTAESVAASPYLEKRRNLKMNAEAQVIRFVPIKAAAGYLTGYADPEFIDELNTFTLPMLAPGQYRAFEIVGDSMLPTPSGSVIVGEKLDKLDELKQNHAYIVMTKNEGIVYKRVQRNSRSKNRLTLVSDNPIYPPYSVSAGDVLEMWTAQMVISKTSNRPAWDMNQLGSLVSNLNDQVSTLRNKMS